VKPASLQNGNDENFHSLPNMSYYIFQATGCGAGCNTTNPNALLN